MLSLVPTTESSCHLRQADRQKSTPPRSFTCKDGEIRWHLKLQSTGLVQYIQCLGLLGFSVCLLSCNPYEDHAHIVHYLLNYRLQDDHITQPSCTAGQQHHLDGDCFSQPFQSTIHLSRIPGLERKHHLDLTDFISLCLPDTPSSCCFRAAFED